MTNKKRCLIAIVARNVEWIKRSVFELKPDLVFLLTSKDKDDITGKYYIDYAKDVVEFVKKFYKEMGLDPPRLEIITIENPRDLSELYTIAKTLISALLNKDYEVFINITPGLLSWQLMMYYVSGLFKGKPKVFFYDKQTKELVFFPAIQLTPTEQIILDIIAEGKTRPRDILQEYNQRAKAKLSSKATPALISKYLKNLREKGLVEQVNREYKLSALGKFLIEKKDIVEKLKHSLQELL